MNRVITRPIASMMAVAAIAALASPGAPAAQAQEPASHHRQDHSGALPGDSLYQLPVSLEASDGAKLQLADLRGRPLLVTMFYSRCSSVCPLMTAQLQRMVAKLSAPEQDSLRIVMVSFDADQETPESLTEFRKLHHIESPNWILARASSTDVRALAAALGIRYRQLADGSFNHSAVVSLADRDGVVRARSSELTAAPEPAFMAALRTQTATMR